MKPLEAPPTFYRTAIFALALILVTTSVTDALLHVIEFVSLQPPGQTVSPAMSMLKAAGQLLGGIVLLVLVARDWGATERAEKRAAAASRRAAQALLRLDEAIESIDQGFALFDADDRLVRCNSRFRQMYGLTGPYDTGTTFEDLVRLAAQCGQYAACKSDNTEQWIAERVAQHRAGVSPLEQELSDGTWLRIDERVTADGGIVGLRTDITPLKQREAELAAKTTMLEATLGAMAQGVMVWNDNDRLTTYNRRVQELLALPEGLLRPNLPLTELVGYLVDQGEFGGDHDRKRDALIDKILRTMKSSDHHCHERQRPNGTILEIRTTRIPGDLVMITYTDVTEQRVADAQLRESEERFRKLSDSAMEGIIAHENGVIVDANRAAGELMRLPAELMIGRQLLDFIVPERRLEISERIARREETRIEVPCIRHNGERVLIESQNRYVQHRGRYVSMVSFRDVTEQRQTEALMRQAKEAAERASRSKNDFVRTISHELRTPMNGVLGMLELLKEGDLPEPLRTFARTAYASADALLGLLDDLLDLSKMEAGRLSLDVATFDAADVVAAAADVVAARAAVKGLAVVINIPPGLDSTLVGDAARLRQIMLNLIGNAVKFTDNGGVVIAVSPGPPTEQERGCRPTLRFEVQDSGIGISADAQARLFGEFVQVHDCSGRSGGSGLGLAICKRLVELMGGRIGVESAVGQGSRFWFDLPCCPDDNDMINCAGRDNPASLTSFTPFKVSVINATPLVRQALARQIAAWGADVTPCASLHEAAALLGDDTPLLAPLLNGAGISQTDADARGTAVILWRYNGEIAAAIIRPVGAVNRLNHPRVTALEWPLRPKQLLDVLCGRSQPTAASPPISTLPAPLLPRMPAAPAATSGRILLAEDGETNRLVAGSFLERAGYDVFYAFNGREAVEAVQEAPFDVILMDIEMPEMNGLVATRTIRALPPPTGTTPIIALTADALEADRQRSLAAGMNDHLSKPLDRAQLLATVAHWAAQPAKTLPEAAPPEPATEDVGQNLADALNADTLAQLERDLDRTLLSGLIRQFLDESDERIARMQAAINQPESLRREAHTLKSTAGTFGAQRLYELAREIETACTGGDGSTLPQLCRHLPDQLLAAKSGFINCGYMK